MIVRSRGIAHRTNCVCGRLSKFFSYFRFGSVNFISRLAEEALLARPPAMFFILFTSVCTIIITVARYRSKMCCRKDNDVCEMALDKDLSEGM
jgi:hypothetical protein